MSFLDATELDRELQKRVPYKIDIGAVYNYKVFKINLIYIFNGCINVFIFNSTLEELMQN